LKRVDDAMETVIQRDSRPPALLRCEHTRSGRLLSESIALGEAHGNTVQLDAI
jgi:hypothetical protein